MANQWTGPFFDDIVRAQALCRDLIHDTLSKHLPYPSPNTPTFINSRLASIRSLLIRAYRRHKPQLMTDSSYHLALTGAWAHYIAASNIVGKAASGKMVEINAPMLADQADIVWVMAQRIMLEAGMEFGGSFLGVM
ncbi:hypothetical protein KEM56_007198 [Ascosphaera pollenicola]|nr:hypothetical protein KEM56_007198 [Ascosphaera pollenicola]